MSPVAVYITFLIVKGCLNVCVAIVAGVGMKDITMAGFWFALGIADLWLGVRSLN